MKKRVCAYIRVSTEMESQTESLTTQKEIIQNLIAQNNDEEFNPETDIFLDRSTGTKIERGKNSDFNKMLELLGFEITDTKDNFSIKSNPNIIPRYNKIYVKSTSRFSRAGSRGENLLEMLLKKNIEVYFYDLRDSNLSLNPTLLRVQSLVDEQYSLTMSYNWRLYNYRLAQERKIINKRKIYGYDRVIIDNQDYLKINEEEKKVLDIIYDLFINQNYGARKISNYLNENGYKFINGREFIDVTIINILKSRKYLGEECYRNYTKEYLTEFKTKSSNDLETSWLPCPYIEPIITEETYLKVQDIFSSRLTHNRKGKKTSISPLSKLLVCSCCGKHFKANGTPRNETGIQYICSGKRYRGNIYNCDSRAFMDYYLNDIINKKASNFHNYLNDIFRENIDSLQYLIVWLILSYINAPQNQEELLLEQYEDIKAKTNLLIDNLLDSFSDSDEVKAIIQNKINANNEELNRLKKEINIQLDLKMEILNKIKSVSNLQTELTQYWNNIKKTYSYEDYLNELESITVYPKNTKKRIRDNAIFVFKTKIENEIIKLYDELICNAELINFIGTDKIARLDKSKQFAPRYIVRKPNEAQLNQALPYFEEFL